jgi:ABC-type multidrug transport system fused ATPase/permease subunit
MNRLWKLLANRHEASSTHSKNDFVWLLSYINGARGRLALGLSCVLLGSLVATLDPLLMRALIDIALPRRNLLWALGLVGGIGACYLGRSFLSSAGLMVNFGVSQQCVRELRVALIDQMNRLSEEYHRQTPAGEKLTCIEHDVDEIATLGVDIISQSIRAVLFFILNLMMMAKLNPAMTLCVLPLLPLFVFVQRGFQTRLGTRANDVRTKIGSATSLLSEHLSAIPQVQFLGAEETSMRRIVSSWAAMLDAQWVQRRTEMSFSFSMSAIVVIAILSTLAFGSVEVLDKALTIGGLVAFYAYVTRIFEPVSSSMDLYARLQSVTASILRVREILTLEPSVPDRGTRDVALGPLEAGFKLSDVSFAYTPETTLHRFDLRIRAGERIAVIGASGSGKSTLARLLVRAADPLSGCIQLEDSPLSEWRLAALRQTVCYVPQHSVLFQASIRENLLYGNPKATTWQLHDVVEIAQLTHMLKRLPRGLDTPIGSQGTTLSGGEQQRIALARSLLRNAPILILDESTSALDAPTERAIHSAMVNVIHDQTLILISHRLSSVTWVDWIALLEAGKIVDIGNHSSLYGRSPLYKALYEASTDEATA